MLNIKKAHTLGRYRLGSYEALVFKDIQSKSPTHYYYILALYQKDVKDPVFFVTAEAGAVPSSSGEEVPTLCTYENNRRVEGAASTAWADEAQFISRAFQIVAQKYGIPETSIPTASAIEGGKIDAKSSSRVLTQKMTMLLLGTMCLTVIGLVGGIVDGNMIDIFAGFIFLFLFIAIVTTRPMRRRSPERDAQSTKNGEFMAGYLILSFFLLYYVILVNYSSVIFVPAVYWVMIWMPLMYYAGDKEKNTTGQAARGVTIQLGITYTTLGIVGIGLDLTVFPSYVVHMPIIVLLCGAIFLIGGYKGLILFSIHKTWEIFAFLILGSTLFGTFLFFFSKYPEGTEAYTILFFVVVSATLILGTLSYLYSKNGGKKSPITKW